MVPSFLNSLFSLILCLSSAKIGYVVERTGFPNETKTKAAMGT